MHKLNNIISLSLTVQSNLSSGGVWCDSHASAPLLTTECEQKYGVRKRMLECMSSISIALLLNGHYYLHYISIFK